MATGTQEKMTLLLLPVALLDLLGPVDYPQARLLAL